MHQLLMDWLIEQGIKHEYLNMTAILIGIASLLIITLLTHYILKYYALALVKKAAIRSKNRLDDLLIDHNVFNHITFLVPTIGILVLTPILLPEQNALHSSLITLSKVAIAIQVALTLMAILDAFKHLYEEAAQEKYLPLNSTVQVLKLVIIIVTTILSISYLVDRSPIYLLSGLGALTAVLLLVFQDTIKGLVASIQISAYRMVAPGDWIELPKYGADGDVMEIGLNTVKVRNFDNTITTVPTYALISGSFKNWRGMVQSGGRRIKRSIMIDVASIKFYHSDEIEQLKEFRLLVPYLDQKLEEISQWCQQQDIPESNALNARQLTNIGTFRAYIEAYLKSHPKVHQGMTCMVRQLPTEASGLPLQLYFFSNDQDWVRYEGIKSDIFDHLYAIAPHFGLRIFQHPSGYDWQHKSE